MDFKWKLSRPGIELEFETGSIGEAIGLLEEEGTQISAVFGFTMGDSHGSTAITSGTVATVPVAEAKPPRGRGPNKPKPEAVAPAPLPVPSEAPAAPGTPLPPNALPTGTAPPSLAIPADGGIPPFLARPAAAPPPLPAAAAPPLAPLPPTAPPVGVLGPKVIAALETHKTGKPDGGQALADWLATAGLTIKGASFDDACRVLLMTSDEKITAAGILAPLGVAA